VQKQGQAQLSSALDRISERITLAIQTLSRSEAIRGSKIENQTLPYISTGTGGEGVSQSLLKDKAFSISLD
jgi:hypothetical protein